MFKKYEDPWISSGTGSPSLPRTGAVSEAQVIANFRSGWSPPPVQVSFALQPSETCVGVVDADGEQWLEGDGSYTHKSVAWVDGVSGLARRGRGFGSVYTGAACTGAANLKKGAGPGRRRPHWVCLSLARAIAILTVIMLGASAEVGAASAAETDSPSLVGCPLLLENSSTGPCVVALQTELNAVNPGYNLTVDGIFGESTRIAVLDFQGRNHLGADGNVGTVTAEELQRQYDARPSANPNPGGQATTATEVTCADVNTSNPPSASIPPDLQPNFKCYPTSGSGGGESLSPECAAELAIAAVGYSHEGLIKNTGKIAFKKVPFVGWVLVGIDVGRAINAC